MQNQLQVFTNSEFGELGILMVNGKSYFPATQCASILGYSSPQDAVTRHCPHCVKRRVEVQTGKRVDGSAAIQSVAMNFIPESDLYRLITRSKLPSAQRFESFVFDEILPSVHKYGAYLTDEAIHNVIHHPDFAFEIFKAMMEAREKNKTLQAQLADAAPKARYCDEILKTENTIPTSVIAKDFGMSAVCFNHLLHDLGVQFKVGDTWVLYQDYADKGYTKSVTINVTAQKSVVHTFWTQAGRMFLYTVLREHNILPLTEI